MLSNRGSDAAVLRKEAWIEAILLKMLEEVTDNFPRPSARSVFPVLRLKVTKF